MHKKSSKKSSELRKLSEDALNGKTVDLQELSYKDARGLIHELQVHQIELEMQNEELRRAHMELEELRKNYSDLYDFAPVGYFSFDRDGLIRQVNLTGAKKLGIERNFIINKPFSLFISRKSNDVFYDHLRNVFGTGIKQICELKVIGRNRTQFDAQLESIIIQNGEGNSSYCRSVIVDITERKNVEDNLKISEAKYRTLFETMATGVIFQDTRGNIRYVNHAAQSILGLTFDQMKGVISKDHYLLAINEDGTDFRSENHPSMVALKTGKKVNDVVIGVFNAKKEEYRWINFNAVLQFRQGENKPYEVHTTFEDITERKKFEELRVENERFINKDNTRSEFFTILSHEYVGNRIFNTPCGK